jgi:hypothetical protein
LRSFRPAAAAGEGRRGGENIEERQGGRDVREGQGEGEHSSFKIAKQQDINIDRLTSSGDHMDVQ